jgi:hypothetical protein
VSGQAKRILGILLGIVGLGVGLGLYVGLYLTAAPGSARAVTTASGTHLYLATVPAAAANDAHPTWVSYYVVNSSSGDWRHDTTYVLPAHTLVHMTIFEYDTQTGLRNAFLSQVQGTSGGTMTLDGRSVGTISPDTASHVFAIPQIGLNIPLQGPSSNAKNLCGNAPCSLSNAHTTTTFTFRTPARGLYRWQCFVPCGAGFIAGWGGPMQTVGYMDGYIQVV